jgi:hypothetical protein
MLRTARKRKECPHGRLAELPRELPLELEEDAQHLGDDENNLAVGHIQQKRLPHPLTPFLQALGMTGGTKVPHLAGKG